MYRIVPGYRQEIEALVKNGQDKGLIRMEIIAQAVARIFFSIVQPLALLRHMSEEKFARGRHIAGAWPLFLGTIAK